MTVRSKREKWEKWAGRQRDDYRGQWVMLLGSRSIGIITHKGGPGEVSWNAHVRNVLLKIMKRYIHIYFAAFATNMIFGIMVWVQTSKKASTLRQFSLYKTTVDGKRKCGWWCKVKWDMWHARMTRRLLHSSTTPSTMTYCSCPSDPPVLLYLQMVFDRVAQSLLGEQVEMSRYLE